VLETEESTYNTKILYIQVLNTYYNYNSTKLSFVIFNMQQSKQLAAIFSLLFYKVSKWDTKDVSENVFAYFIVPVIKAT
jgi:hypothetical protein